MAIAYNDTLFRTQFPEFSDTTLYPEALLSMYWSVGTDFISADDNSFNMLSGNSLVYGINLMTAHLLTVGKQSASKKQGGFITNSSIDKVSVTKLAPPVKDMWDFWLASTAYGITLAALLDVVSVGGIAVGGLPERFAFRKVGGVFI